MRTPHDLLGFLAGDAAVQGIARRLDEGGRLVALGSSGSSAALVAGALAARLGRPVVFVVAHLDDADDCADMLNSFASGGGAARRAPAPGGEGVTEPPFAARFPALEIVPGESQVSLDLFAERLAVARRFAAGVRGPCVLVCPVQALMQAAPSPERFDSLSLRLREGDDAGLDAVVRWLDGAGYERADTVEEAGQYAVRGGILDVFPPASTGESGGPVRLDFFGETIETISEFDLDSMGSGRRVKAVEFIGADAGAVLQEEGSVSLLELLRGDAAVVLHETIEVIEQARGYYERVSDARGISGPPAVMKLLQERFRGFLEINAFSAGTAGAQDRVALPVRPLPEFARDVGDALREVGAMASSRRVVVYCQAPGEAARLGEMLTEEIPDRAPDVAREVAYLHRGFLWGDDPSGEDDPRRALALVPYHEIVHRYETRRRVRRLRGGRATDAFIDLQPGDYVVHQDHGIAKFLGLRTMKQRALGAQAHQEDVKARLEKRKGRRGAAADGAPEGHADAGEEYLTLEFAGGGRLHVPASQIEHVQKYVGGRHGKPPLSTLGGKKWQHQKERTGEAVKDLASEMLRVQAARAATPGVRFPADTAWQKEFEAEFPFEETEDQTASLGEIKRDMQAGRPMDRLLCGDVGYGKTELAIRAAFKACEFGRQVAVLVPTTVLAEQHERTFRSRFAGFPFRVESLSRFKTVKEQNETLAAVRKGQVDVIIGTHRLLSRDVKFADLGLVVIDEEQRFGVEHKQALLSLRMTVDVLTLSATPIPRTLHMAMLGLRDISSLTTPPLDRRAVVTEVIPYNEKRIGAAISRELAREGQVFFVHNRVHNIREVAERVASLAPGARVIHGHGQMEPHELEAVMLAFMRREADILVSTTIIESGIDIPTANTMIINDADRFGLADLHQLRGRVGRYKHRAYCYLLLPQDRPVTEQAQRRLRAIEEFSMLGAGFKISMRDLEIRGAGNLLGAEQSGHIAAVGYDMYCRLLDRAVRSLRHERVAEVTETTIDIGVTGAIPKSYIPSDSRRMEAYRRLSRAASAEDLAAVAKDLAEAYGEPPKAVARLLALAELRVAAHALGVRSVSIKERDVVLRCEAPDAPKVAHALAGSRGTVRTLAAAAPPPGASPPDSGASRRGGVDAVWEVYFRPPDTDLAPETLLRVLGSRLGDAARSHREAAQASIAEPV